MCFSISYMKLIGVCPLLKAFEHKLNDLFNKILFFKEILYLCPFLISPSFGSYRGFLESGMLLISKLLKQGFPVASLKSSLYLCHKLPHTCSYVVPEHLHSPVNFRVVMSATISTKNRCSIRVIFYLFHLYLLSYTGVQHDLMWCRIY